MDFSAISPRHYPIIAPLRGSHGLSAQGREGRYQAGPKGRNLEVGVS